jgi:pimeloyl-ACP methyl ester carboxylesterase
MIFTASHRGGSGQPLVCLHGFGDSWRTWELVLPALERRHDVLAPTLAGHAGGPRLDGDASEERVVDAAERAMDDAGFDTAHLAGNSLGGYIALKLAERGRTRSVVALAPAGGWAAGDESFRDVFALQLEMHQALKTMAPNATALLASPEGRRRVTALNTVAYEHIPVDLLAHMMLSFATAPAAPALVDHALAQGFALDPERITCPVRVVWGTEDQLLPWPSAAARFAHEWLPHADWVVLDGVGHPPQLDVPVETAQLILDFTGG